MTDQMRPLDGEQLTADLRSGDPERVANALDSLDRAWRQRQFVPLPMPRPDCLTAFGDVVPVEMLARYLSVVENYPDFEPTPSGSERRRALVEAVISYGRGELTYNAALALRVDHYPEHAVADALGYLRDRGLNGRDEILAAQRLVDHLLDSNATRRATVDVLRIWVITDRFPEVIDAVRPHLDDAEQARFERDGQN